jgi:dTDP-4-amino-4,6-dideoxygalactose transaminase
MHRLPMFREESLRRGEELLVTDRLSRDCLMLPTYNHLTAADLGHVADALKKARGSRQLFRAATA